MGVDLIGALPTDRHQKTDTICVYVDHYTDQYHLVATKTTVNSEGIANLHYQNVFKLHSLPEKVFSDRGPQFASRFMRALYKRLGIESAFTTVYHPEGNGKVECKN